MNGDAFSTPILNQQKGSDIVLWVPTPERKRECYTSTIFWTRAMRVSRFCPLQISHLFPSRSVQFRSCSTTPTLRPCTSLTPSRRPRADCHPSMAPKRKMSNSTEGKSSPPARGQKKSKAVDLSQPHPNAKSTEEFGLAIDLMSRASGVL